MTSHALHARPRPLIPILFGWLVIAVGLGASGRIAALQPPIPQVVVVALTVATLAGGLLLPGARAWLLAADPRSILALHATRFLAGLAFLFYQRTGALPAAFAMPAGIGDMLVGITALALLFAARTAPPARAALLFWNAFGLTDLFFVVATAARLGMADPASMQSLLQLPLSLLPTFLVPILFATHFLLFAQLLRRPLPSGVAT